MAGPGEPSASLWATSEVWQAVGQGGPRLAETRIEEDSEILERRHITSESQLTRRRELARQHDETHQRVG